MYIITIKILRFITYVYIIRRGVSFVSDLLLAVAWGWLGRTKKHIPEDLEPEPFHREKLTRRRYLLLAY